MSEEQLLRNYDEMEKILFRTIDNELPHALDDLIKAVTLMKLIIRDAYEIKYLSKYARDALQKFLGDLEFAMKLSRKRFNRLSAIKNRVEGPEKYLLDAMETSENITFDILCTSLIHMISMMLSSFAEKSEEKEILKEQGEKLKKMIEKMKEKSEKVSYVD